ncbi:carboxypeptidase-like regulatory domain-containing protein [Salegentibacter chungangensis]|uniref:Carboxypeptidase-like regulatory domain-containing protein n=1 Tax=Salegentibacter chungangensis TaxID=1335724 RepID=A0ABW3NUZ2_9FLAO
MFPLKPFFILLFVTTLSFSQNTKLSILDSHSKEPIEGANVLAGDSGSGGTTDKNGNFSLPENISTQDSLVISHLGYKTRILSFFDLRKSRFRVYLRKTNENLEEVNIRSNTRLQHRIRYESLPEMKDGIFAFGSVLTGNKLYLVGGNLSHTTNKRREFMERAGMTRATFKDFTRAMRSDLNWLEYSENLHIYDLNTGKWSTSPLKFEKRAFLNLNAIGNKLYATGGKSLSTNRIKQYLGNKIEIYDIENDSLYTDLTNPHQAVNFASFVYDDQLILLGGSTKRKRNQGKVYTDKMHLYKPETGYWYEVAKMPKAKETTGILLNNKFYLIGGFNKSPLKSIESYDIKSGEWTNLGELFENMERPGLAAHGEIIYIYNKGKLLSFNTPTGKLSEYYIDLNLQYAALHYYNNHLYIVGGAREINFEVIPSQKIYRIALDEFRKTEVKRFKVLDKNIY